MMAGSRGGAELARAITQLCDRIAVVLRSRVACDGLEHQVGIDVQPPAAGTG